MQASSYIRARPESPRLFEAVLILGEMDTFMRNAAGEDARDMLELFDAIAATEGDERPRRTHRETGRDGAERSAARQRCVSSIWR